MDKPLLEICAYNVHTCMVADKAGAGRIELCNNPKEGGTTPGFGTIEYVMENASIPVYVMIRPRGGNFVYDEHELAIMQKDIKICKILGCAGVVLGVLTADNKVDIQATKNLVEYANPMGVTFHKAFDEVTDAGQALEDVIATGCERILTSGLQDNALQGADMIKRLINQAYGRITIMPGGGVRGNNVDKIMSLTGATQLHSSTITNAGDIADVQEIQALLAALG